MYQVIVHVAPAPCPADPPADKPAASRHLSGRSRGNAARPGHPADPARCHVQDGPAISVSTAQMITCTAALSSGCCTTATAPSWTPGRRRRRPGAALRRAARDRDHCRCRFPGCESRRVDLHRIQHSINGGRTSLKNLISLCPYHHMLDPRRRDTSSPPDRQTRSPSTGPTAPCCPPAPPHRTWTAPSTTATTPPSDRHHHPSLVRRAPRPGLRHPRLLRQRRLPRTPPRPGQPAGRASRRRRTRTRTRALAAHRHRNRRDRRDTAALPAIRSS